jgi:YidC/Oxa1 family membrane protein insertase
MMAAVMMLNQKFISPPSSDQAAQQQKMMKWMPLMFVLILYQMPSGLCLYWTASTAIGLFERWLIEKHTSTLELTPVGQKPRRPGGVGKSQRGDDLTWLGKLQKMADEHVKKQEARRKKRQRKGK